MITAQNIRHAPGLKRTAEKEHVDQAWMRLRMDYDDGILRWKYWPKKGAEWNERFAGQNIGMFVPARNNFSVTIKYKHYYCHRLIWIYHNGDINSCDYVRHRKDSVGHQDRIENLFLVKRG